MNAVCRVPASDIHSFRHCRACPGNPELLVLRYLPWIPRMNLGMTVLFDCIASPRPLQHKIRMNPMRPSNCAPLRPWCDTFVGRSHSPPVIPGITRPDGGIDTVCRTLSWFCCTREGSVLRNRAAYEQGVHAHLFDQKKPNKFKNLMAPGFSSPSGNQRQRNRGR